MKRVFICSPFRAQGVARQRLHRFWMARMMREAIRQGHAPFAPHGLYPGILDDADPEQRSAGVAAGLAWLEVCDEVWALRVSPTEGMQRELARAEELCLPVFWWDVATVEGPGEN